MRKEATAFALGLWIWASLSGAVEAASSESARLERERLGLEERPAVSARSERRVTLGGDFDLLLIPDSTAARVMAFDPATGDLVDADFIPADPDHLSTPIQAILSAGGDSILVSDQTGDLVYEYALNGSFRGVFAPAGGVDPAILDNPRGIALRANGNLLVAVASGDNADAIAEFDTAGNYVGNFVANGDGGLDGPWAVVPTDALLVTGDTNDAVQEFDIADGSYLSDVSPIDDFPEQLSIAANGNLLVAVFSGGDEDVIELERDGTVVGVYDVSGVGGVRGVYELANGNLLVTNGSGVHEVTRGNLLVETKISGASARFVSRVAGVLPPGLALGLTGGTCPGPVTISLSGGTPGGQVAVLRGTGLGRQVVPFGPCAGVVLDLAGVSLLAAVPLDGNGEASFTGNAPFGACGRPLQALDVSSCTTSNVSRVPQP